MNMTDWIGSIVGILGLFVAIIAIVQARKARELAERANWFTGAMESHSDMQLRIAAREAKIKIVWWDKSRHGKPPSLASIKHGEEVNLDTIYLHVPPELRLQRPLDSWWHRLVGK